LKHIKFTVANEKNTRLRRAGTIVSSQDGNAEWAEAVKAIQKKWQRVPISVLVYDSDSGRRKKARVDMKNNGGKGVSGYRKRKCRHSLWKADMSKS
jgi:hypothetical protein